MPSGNAILGRIGVALESLANPGEVVLLNSTAVSSLPASLTTQPNAVSGQSSYSGMRLFIVVTGNSSSGALSIAGKDFTQAQGSQTATTPTIPASGSTSNPDGVFEYLTPEVFSTVNSSGVTLASGTLTGGVVKIYGIQAASKLLPGTLEAEEKYGEYSPEEQRGLTSRDTNIQQLVKMVDIGKIEQTFYPDTCLWLPHTMVGAAPSEATIPASPTVIKASTAVSAFPITSYTAQPNGNGPDALLQFVVTGSSAIGTVTARGTNRFGQTISETVQCGLPGASNGNGTWYTHQAFSTLDTATGMTATGLTSGSVAVNAIQASQLTWLAADTGTGASSSIYSGCIEWYTGTDAVALPFASITETSLEWGTEKETKWGAKGFAQDMLSIGDRSITPQAASAYTIPIDTAIGAFSKIWQPFDVGLAGWQHQVWIDALSGTPGTTSYNQVLEGKIIFKTPQKASYTGTNWNRLTRVFRQQRQTEIELTVDFLDLIQYEQFRRQFVKQLIQIDFIGPYVGVSGSTPVYKKWSFIFAAKILEAQRDTGGGEKVVGKFKLRTEYTPSLGYEYKLVVITQQPPIYNN